MATGRIRRSARRGLAVTVLGWVGVAAFAVLVAPSASADAQVTVPIRDLTVPTVHVDAGGTVTFVNEIQDKIVQVGGGVLPTVTSVTAHTDVSLTLPSGVQPLAPGDKVAEKFASSCLNCLVTFTYRLQGKTSLTQPLSDAALRLLPPLPAPTVFVVNTLLTLPNLQGVNVPQLPPVTIPSLPALPALPGGAPPVGVPPIGPTDQPPAAGPVVAGVDGTQYTYDTGAGAPQLSPADVVAASGLDPTRSVLPDPGMGRSDGGSANGSGGLAGSYDGASVPVFGQPAGLNGLAGPNGVALDDQSAVSSSTAATTLPAAALAAVLALAAVTAALVRTHQAARASR